MEELLKAIDRGLASRRWLIALDRDGTLVPYTERPEQARVGGYLYALINSLAELPGVRVAIVSARSCAQLRAEFDSSHAIMAGNYGMEVLFPDGRLVVQPKAAQAVPYLKMMRDEWAARLDLKSGIILEDHGYSLCLHWKQLPVEQRPDMEKTVSEVAADFPSVSVRALATSHEALPDMAWDKGRALAFIESNLDGAPGEATFPFYGGDTESDRPAFVWVNERRGISVRVGGGDSLGAAFHLPNARQLIEALSFVSERRLTHQA